MKEIVHKFRKIESSLSKERGEFNLFALFLREDSANKWDLLVSADWIENNKSEALQVISQKIQKHLDKKELVDLSRIVLIKENNPALEAFHKAISVEHGNAEIQEGTFFGLNIKHAFIITSRGKPAEAN
jgi:hypothetical protein